MGLPAGLAAGPSQPHGAVTSCHLLPGAGRGVPGRPGAQSWAAPSGAARSVGAPLPPVPGSWGSPYPRCFLLGRAAGAQRGAARGTGLPVCGLSSTRAASVPLPAAPVRALMYGPQPQ